MLSKSSVWESERWGSRFFTIWTGQAFSLLGSQLVQFALVWWLTKTTGSATVLATATLVALLPQVFINPIAGTLVDRYPRRIIMIVADGLIAAATGVLAVLFLSGKVQIWHVYLLMFIRSTAGGFHWPSMQAATSLMVPKEHLTRIQGLNQILNGGMNIASAPLGALLLEILPIQGILAIDISTAFLAIIPLLFIAIPEPRQKTSGQAEPGKVSVWQDFRAGLKYVMGWPGLVILLIMATLVNLLLTPASSLMPILVFKHFNGQAWHLAWLEAVWGGGAIAGGLLLSIWGGFRRRILTAFLGLVLIGLSNLVIGVLPSNAFTFAVAAALVLGFALPITNGPLLAVVQAAVAPEMQGRVFTLVASLASAMTPLGLIIAGPVADAFGVQTWYLAGGVLTMFFGILAPFIPAVMNVEAGRGEPAVEPVVSFDPAALSIENRD